MSTVQFEHNTQEFAAEYKRVWISLKTHFSILDEHTKGTVVNLALPSLYGGSLEITLKFPSIMGFLVYLMIVGIKNPAQN